MYKLTGKIYKLGINPCIDVPKEIVEKLYKDSGKTNGPIQVRGTLNGEKFEQTIVKYQGRWRLYLNTQMRKDCGIGVGDTARFEFNYDPLPRTVLMPKKLAEALTKNQKAKRAFEKLPSSRQKQILRYLNSLKSDAAIERNVKKVIEEEV